MPRALIHLRRNPQYEGIGKQSTLCGKPKAVAPDRSVYNTGHATCARCLRKRRA